MAKKKRKGRQPENESELERTFRQEWSMKYPDHLPIAEYKFSPTRKYRFDFAWITRKLAVEVHGYGPGHYSIPGMTQDFDKNMEALKMNWRVVYLTSLHLEQKNIDRVVETIAFLLGLNEPENKGYIPFHRRNR